MDAGGPRSRGPGRLRWGAEDFRGSYDLAMRIRSCVSALAVGCGRPGSNAGLGGQLPDFVADVWVQVGNAALVNPIQRDAIGGELEGLHPTGCAPGRLRKCPRWAC